MRACIIQPDTPAMSACWRRLCARMLSSVCRQHRLTSVDNGSTSLRCSLLQTLRVASGIWAAPCETAMYCSAGMLESGCAGGGGGTMAVSTAGVLVVIMSELRRAAWVCAHVHEHSLTSSSGCAQAARSAGQASSDVQSDLGVQGGSTSSEGPASVREANLVRRRCMTQG